MRPGTTPYTYQFVVDSSISHQRFILPNSGVDTSQLTVRVQKSKSDTTTNTYILAENFLEITGKTNVYFLQEVTNQQFEVVFGDGIIGSALSDGNVVIIDYILSHGAAGNTASSFFPSAPLGYPINGTYITTLIPASGGLDAETTEEIRFSAPKNYEAQGRAVTVSDYQLHVSQDYTNADSVACWGGEDHVPPQYGKVFVSVKPVNGFVITDTAKTLILSNIIRKRNIVSIIPEFVDPDYTFINVTNKTKYDPSNTNKTQGDIMTGVYTAITTFAATELDKFNLDFRYSRLLEAIDNSDQSISSNVTTIQVKKIFKPALDVITNYDTYFYNAVVPGSLSSTSFVSVHDPKLNIPYVNGMYYTLQDDSRGNIQMWVHGIGISDSVVRICGSINYKTGHIALTEFMPYQVDADGSMSLIMTPLENDISPVRNNILFIKPQDIKITTIAVTS